MHEKSTCVAWKVTLIVVIGLFIAGIVLGSDASKNLVAPATITPGHVEPSGSFNTRIYVTGVTPLNHTQNQGNNFTLTGYGDVANISSGKWEHWYNVSIALKMNNSFMYTAPSSIVKTATNSTGNFTLNYRIMYNQTVGPWIITAGLAPVPNYNYTCDPSFVNTYTVTITADVTIPKSSVKYTPDVFFNNDPFNISGRLLNKGGIPVVGKTVKASLGSSSNITSSVTNSTGYFLITMPPSGAINTTTLNFYFLKSGFYNAITIKNFTTIKFLNQAQISHAFVGKLFSLLLNSPTNPQPRNATLVIVGVFTYNAVAFGAGDGLIKNKLLSIWWNTKLIANANVTTDNSGHYTMNHFISASEPAVLPYTTAMVTVALNTALPAGKNFSQNVYVRPQIATIINAITNATWLNQSIIIHGSLAENEPSTWTSPVPGVVVSVTLWNGSTILATIYAVTDSTGSFSATFSPQSAAFLNYTVTFQSQNQYLASSFGGSLHLFLQANVPAPPTTTWVLWLILPVAAGIILLGIAYVKISKKVELQRMRGYMEEKIDIVRDLVNAGKFREAISYCYHVLVQVATLKYDLDDVKESRTVREFIDMLVTDKGVSRELAFPFMMNVLDSIYGHAETLTIDQVANIVTLLGNLYMDITKDMTQSFKL